MRLFSHSNSNCVVWLKITCIVFIEKLNKQHGKTCDKKYLMICDGIFFLSNSFCVLHPLAKDRG